MNNFTEEELGIQIPKCPKCGNKLADTAAIFWNREMTKIIESRAYCSNKFCDYLLVNKYE